MCCVSFKSPSLSLDAAGSFTFVDLLIPLLFSTASPPPTPPPVSLPHSNPPHVFHSSQYESIPLSTRPALLSWPQLWSILGLGYRLIFYLTVSSLGEGMTSLLQFFSFLHVYVWCLYMCVHVFVGVPHLYVDYVCGSPRRLIIRRLLGGPLLYSLRQGSSVEPRAHWFS